MSPSIEAAVINAKYINVVPFYRQGAGVWAVCSAHFKAEHGKLDDPVHGQVSCDPQWLSA